MLHEQTTHPSMGGLFLGSTWGVTGYFRGLHYKLVKAGHCLLNWCDHKKLRNEVEFHQTRYTHFATAEVVREQEIVFCAGD